MHPLPFGPLHVNSAAANSLLSLPTSMHSTRCVFFKLMRFFMSALSRTDLRDLGSLESNMELFAVSRSHVLALLLGLELSPLGAAASLLSFSALFFAQCKSNRWAVMLQHRIIHNSSLQWGLCLFSSLSYFLSVYFFPLSGYSEVAAWQPLQASWAAVLNINQLLSCHCTAAQHSKVLELFEA